MKTKIVLYNISVIPFVILRFIFIPGGLLLEQISKGMLYIGDSLPGMKHFDD